MLLPSARGAFLALADLHPAIHLFIDGKDISVVYPGTDLDRTLLSSFVLKAVSCVEKILGPR